MRLHDVHNTWLSLRHVVAVWPVSNRPGARNPWVFSLACAGDAAETEWEFFYRTQEEAGAAYNRLLAALKELESHE